MAVPSFLSIFVAAIPSKELPIILHSSLFCMRLIFVIAYLFCIIPMFGQERLKRHEQFKSYVLCDGKPVEAIYRVEHPEDSSVQLGINQYLVPAIDSTLSGHIEVPATVKAPNGQEFWVCNVSRAAFANCRHITGVSLPDSLYGIGDQSFLNCVSIRQLVLPPGVDRIWPHAFHGCERLQRVVLKGKVPPDAYNDIFDERTLNTATLVVPAAADSAYRDAFVWNMFRYRSCDWDNE